MKKWKKLSIIFLLALWCAGCSGDTDGENAVFEDQKKAQLTFGAVLNNLIVEKAALQEETGDLPECSDDLPAFMEVVLTRNGIPVVGSFQKPFKIQLNTEAVPSNQAGYKKYTSKKAADLELEPGNYSLEQFSVLNLAGERIWKAPLLEENITSYSGKSLPYNFSLAPAKNKQLDIDVVCISNNLAIIPIEQEALKFCIFGTYCNENGRQADAMRIIANLWEYSGDEGEPRGTLLYENVSNEITVTDYFDEGYSETVAEPLCFALPDTFQNEEFYMEITLGSGVGYEAEERLIRRGIITKDDIRSLYDGEDSLDYYHIREGNCNLPDSPELLDIITETEN